MTNKKMVQVSLSETNWLWVKNRRHYYKVDFIDDVVSKMIEIIEESENE